jgi:hypothetical protein
MTSNAVFETDFDVEWNGGLFTLLERTQTKFWKTERNLTQEMTKMPLHVNFANKIEIKCRERCNWSEIVQIACNARKEELISIFRSKIRV